MAETVRIDSASHAALSVIARAKHIPLAEALARAVEAYRREWLIQAMDADYAALRAEAKEWAEEQDERASWDTTSADGLNDE
ncbi:MAG: toxin-antitoxin system protein [Myxococcota bacterium]|nr:toxin-antitoxin system protein [Myxococcota bacterium]